MADTFTIELADREAVDYLSRLQRRLGDPGPLMRDIAGVLEEEAQQAFASEADPESGAPWQPLGADYVARPVERGGRGGDAHPILQREGDLARLTTAWGRDYALVGSGEPYAARHQLGDAGPGGMPARPYLGLSGGGAEEILDLAGAWLLQ